MSPFNHKHCVIVAAEESGDRHAAEMVTQLKKQYPLCHFTGIGGRNMQNAGVELISDLASFGVTGISEVLRYLHVIRRTYKAIREHLLAHKPDLLVLVDSPSFNLRLAKFAKQHQIRVLYYVSPQIWAWKAKRIKIIKENVDHMAVILPFEKNLYVKAGVPVSFVGHPSIKDIKPCLNHEEVRLSLGLPTHARLIALLPGSRKHEIEHHMPVLIETVQKLLVQHPNLHFVIPVAASITPEIIADFYKNLNLPVTLIKGKAKEIASCSDCIVVASGTASLECALFEKPMCIIYKLSWLSYFFASLLLKIQYVGLCNLLVNRMIVPELLQYDCSSSELSKVIIQLLESPGVRLSMQEHLRQLRISLSAQKADCTVDELVLKLISE